MENTTYDYENEIFAPCDKNEANNLGAQLSILFYFMFVFSLLGNGLVLAIIYKFERLTTVTSILLLNLVASSLIFMSSLPFWGIYMQRSRWIFGNAMCKIVGSTYSMGFYSSVLFLTLLTFDRHLAVVYSLPAAHLRNQKYAVISCAVVWLLSGLSCIRPMLIHGTFKYIDGNTYCEETYNDNIDLEKLMNAGFYIQLIIFLILPLAVIIYCYIRITITVVSSKIGTKFQTVRLIFIIVLLFFICWTPFNIVELMEYKTKDCETLKKLTYTLQITRLMAYFYFCISPIFYTFVGRKFQNYFRQLLIKYFPSLKKYISVNEISRTNISTKITSNDLINGGQNSLLTSQSEYV
ncbi:C-C chemokine receptor type 3-like [Cyprinodon tularosa]|uniref:C-C chemokine receptor type 3-like n=1 Tax=Cyprinodon tularosa TaxID=77115 RepID=UPI0018E28380|nr:C-C chemokine receptor type 3-like [Cyprinodon tularosa]